MISAMPSQRMICREVSQGEHSVWCRLSYQLIPRVRFARLSWIRKILGGAPEDIAPVFDAALFAEDDQYLILDVVLNWVREIEMNDCFIALTTQVADGLLLAFFHAIKDKDPVQNNDPSRSNDEWTNYCGTASMGEDVSSHAPILRL